MSSKVYLKGPKGLSNDQSLRLRPRFVPLAWLRPDPKPAYGAIFSGAFLLVKNRFGPAINPADQLKLVVVKVGFDQAEAADLDARRGHHTRAAFLRAAGLGFQLQATFDPKLLTTWQESARVQACFTQINDIAYSLNLVRKNQGEEAAAAELLARSSEILAAFKKIHAVIMPDGEA